tara:strand:+ start:84 stop:776 length:693 start_codon:yes stop_codon:yes gene_type:complete
MPVMSQVSPVGKLEWAKLFTPEKKFATEQKPHGVYAIDLILSKAASIPLLKLLKDMDDANYKQAAEDALKAHREKSGKKDTFKDGLAFAKAKGLERNAIPGKPVKDANFNETGEIKFSFKEDAVWEKRDGSWKKEIKPTVVNAKNKPWKQTVDIGNGSTGKISFVINSYQKPACGVSIKLRGVQVLEWLPYGGGQNSSPFQEEEGDDVNSEDAILDAEEMFSEESADVPF